MTVSRAQRALQILIIVVAGLGSASGRAAEPTPKVQALLDRYEAAWESRNPFQLVDLSAPGEDPFAPLLGSDRFDQIARTAVDLRDVTVEELPGNGSVAVELVKVVEELFHVGTVSRGVARFRLTLVSVDDAYQIAKHEQVEPPDGERPYLSSNPATWDDGRPAGERLFYVAYQKVLAGEVDEARQMLRELLKLPVLVSQLDSVRYMVGNQAFFAQIHYVLGFAEASSGNQESAAEQMQLAVGINPDFPLALNWMADDAAEQGALEEAVRLWRRSLAVATEQPAIAARLEFYEAARQHYPDGSKRTLFLSTRGAAPDKSIEILKNLLTLDRKNAETRRRLAVAYLLNYDPDSAEKVLLEAEFHKPEDKETHYLLGRTYVAMRRYDDALAFFGQVWSRDPGFKDTLLFLAELNAMQRRYRNAIGYLREALRYRPDDPIVLFKLGLYSLKAGQRFNALSHLRQARAAQPPASVRGALYDLLKDYQ